jgi:hypothetical protein
VVVLVSLQGEVLARLPRFQLSNPSTPPGPVLLRRGDQNFVLSVKTSSLKPIATRWARRLRRFVDPSLALPPLSGTVDDNKSHDWRWMDLEPGGDVLLAQWFGYLGSECQVPIAHLIPVEEGAAAPVTGAAAPGNVPASIALGWTRNGRALVELMKGYCGTPAAGSGVWGFWSPGHGSALPLPTIAGAYQFRMWGPSSAPSQP